MPDFYLGLDLGQASDYTAVAILEAVAGAGDPVYDVRHLERFALRTSYPAIANSVAEMVKRKPLDGCTITVVDATGVGRPVVNMLQDLGMDIVPVTITGGDSVQFNLGEYRVPKRDLVGQMQVLLQAKRLRIAKNLQNAAVLQQELLNFQVKIDATTAHDSYGAWREGTHDDLVLAVALACWYAEQRGGRCLCMVDQSEPDGAQDDDDDQADQLYR